MMHEAITVEGLSKWFGRFPAVRNLSFTCARGEVLGLLGPNGAGKTTTLRILATVLRPTSGVARVLGYDVVRQAREVRRSIGVLTEHSGLYGRLTPRELLWYFGRLYGLPEEVLAKRVAFLLETLDLGEVADKPAEGLSRGTRQKVALARALVHNPPVLLLDEPTFGLDVFAARQVREFIRQFREEGRAILLSTHLMEEAERLCDRVAILNHGRLIALGTLEELRRASGLGRLEEIFLRAVGDDPAEPSSQNREMDTCGDLPTGNAPGRKG